MESHCERVVLTRRGLCSTIPLLSLSLSSLTFFGKLLQGFTRLARRRWAIVWARVASCVGVLWERYLLCAVLAREYSVVGIPLGLGSVEKKQT